MNFFRHIPRYCVALFSVSSIVKYIEKTTLPFSILSTYSHDILPVSMFISLSTLHCKFKILKDPNEKSVANYRIINYTII